MPAKVDCKLRKLIPIGALLSPEEVDAGGMIKEQIGGILTQDVCGLFREQGIGEDEGGRRSRHGPSKVNSRGLRGVRHDSNRPAPLQE
jgi:hypothetical protein